MGATRLPPAEAVAWTRTVALPGWPASQVVRYRDPHGLLEAAMRQWLEVHVRQSPRRWPLGLPSTLVRQVWATMADDPGYDELCARLYGRRLPVTDDVTRMARTWEAACHAERLDPRHPTHLPVLFLLDQTLHVPGGYAYTSRCGGRVCRVFPPEVCVRHAFAPPRFWSFYRDDAGNPRPT
jgi:hypothetical protein